ncbi:DUF2971 domain-containing protein [Methylocystis sp. B8]|uniref:DUF2971 domain-containing protein n=1 Tax=Methylocystis sp. B8 TaxID=544938 RepID=UPI0010FF5D88|nr:DUF2971 domain-containing protein [Methylocystis sp. B8]TLG79021.1 DUF2971 domain-containing protein [Methylocystis sp. B8]
MTDLDFVPPDMRAKLQKFDHEAGQIIASFVGTIEASPPPSIIYHYTNDVGLRGILETGNIWLTDIFNLNDPSELSYGFSHVVKILNSKAVDGPPPSKLFAQQIEALLVQGGIQAAAHYFVSSFSSTGDDLGQWRAYADNGRGYALGFDAKELEKAFTKESDVPIPNNCTFPITYDDSKLVELHMQLVERMFPLLSLPYGRGLSSEGIREYISELYVLFAIHALRSVLFFKHEAYKNETEYRFLQIHRADVPPPEVKLRSRPYSLVKYREFDWRSAAAGALKEIVIGPAADREKAFQFAADCLRSFHDTVFEPFHSKIPYKAV